MYNAPPPARPGRAFDRRDPSFFKTRLCTQFAAGACRYGDRCTYAHGEAELRPPVESAAATAVTAAAAAAGVPTSRVCFRWATTGACVHGARCHFEHVLGGVSAATGVPAVAPAPPAASTAPAAAPAPTTLRPVGGGAAVAANRARAACAALGVGGAAGAGVPADAVAAVFAAAQTGELLAPTPWADDGRPHVASG